MCGALWQDIAFIQGEAVSVNAPLTAALQAEWFVRVIQVHGRTPYDPVLERTHTCTFLGRMALSIFPVMLPTSSPLSAQYDGHQMVATSPASQNSGTCGHLSTLE